METSENTVDSSRPWQSYHTVYTNAKAGMDGVDKEKVQRIVYEMSKGSKYFENEERKEAFIRQKVENLRTQCEKLTAADINHYKKVADKRILELEASRDLSRIWLHVDMDAFYAAVETLSNPALKGKPVAVGSMSMISTANYEARKFGVRAAMPGFIARKLCPELIFVPVDFKKYTYYSDLTRKVFQRYDPNFMAASLDEAYLDITEVCKERDIKSGEIAKELRSSVHGETGLTCSAGVAPNRLLAKVCSDINKPNGQFVLPNDRMAVVTFISSLPIRKIGGIGKVTEHILRGVFDIITCEQMLQKGSYLCALFSQSTADFFLSVGLGIGKTDPPQVRSRKSISNERTFPDTEDEALLNKRLAELAEMLSTDMQKEGLRGRTLTLKLKTATFEVRTRAVTLQKYISSTEDILKHASKLLKAELPISLRLIGVCCRWIPHWDGYKGEEKRGFLHIQSLRNLRFVTFLFQSLIEVFLLLLGLRVSHFNEDKCEASSDPTQKTITKFIVSGDANRKSSPSLSDINDHDFVSDTETNLSIESRQTCYSDCRDPLDGHHSAIADCHSCPLSKNDVAGKVETLVKDVPNSDFSKIPQVLESDSPLQRLLECGSLKNVSSGLDSCQEEKLLWLNDYKCSLCGVELPPSFVEERQEHSDFHLAEKLQKEESTNTLTAPVLTRSRIQKQQIIGQSNSKKRKLSQKEGSYIRIDHFFVKSSPSL